LDFPFPLAAKEQFRKLEFKTLAARIDLFREEIVQAVAPTVERITDATQFDALYQNASEIAFHMTEKAFHFSFDRKEYILPVRKDLLGEGYSIEECLPLVKKLLHGNKTIVFFDRKSLRHQLALYGEDVSCPYEDAALLAYLTDSNGATGTLEEASQQAGLRLDTCATNVLAIRQRALDAHDEVAERIYHELELPLSDVLYEMEVEGVRLDSVKLDEMGMEYEAELKTLSEEIEKLAGHAFNINSPMQLGAVLFDELGLPAPKKTKKGGYATNAEVLDSLSDYEIVRKIQRYRIVQKLRSTYIEGFRPLIDRTGRVHTTYNQTQTTTGRLSSSNPNLQNIPTRNDLGRELRKLFLPSEGHIFFDADYSQIELRLIAHFSECQELIDAYREGKDIHAATAAQVFDIPMEAVTPELRRQAKVVNFGIIYGMSAFGLANDLKISPKEASDYIEKYFTRYPALRTYMKQNVEFARETGYVTTLLGRKRKIAEINSSSRALRSFGERAAMNMPLQGSSADIIKLAMLRIANRLKEEGLKAKLVLQVHDELVLDTPVEEKERVREILQYEMENAVQLSVPLPVEVGEGKSWYDAK
ncbi:MAG: DNA polymerase I, partial [Christensenellaceae bacterium]